MKWARCYERPAHHDTLLTAASWVCCHLGAREHYAVPRALERFGRLERLITDAWVPPGTLWSRVPVAQAKRLSERFHVDLAAADVRASTMSLVTREAMWRVEADGWNRLIARNRWFGRQAAAAVRHVRNSGRIVVFAHSYSAREVLSMARQRGWTTVLGQIDPGESHFDLVERLAAEHPAYGPAPERPPAAYFEQWRDECRLADWIVVNSEWSRESLLRAGVDSAKLRVVPLVYEPEDTSAPPVRSYPEAFTRERPLRLLFVGNVAVAKGAAALLEAMLLLEDLPVELRMVGAIGMSVPSAFQSHQAIRWLGSVPRGEVGRYYQDSDLLVFPSLSDGFGMAQVEAQGWRLPIVASRSCGRVVRDGESGLLLDEVSPHAIAAAVRRVVACPQLLDAFSRRADAHHGSLSDLGRALVELEPS